MEEGVIERSTIRVSIPLVELYDFVNQDGEDCSGIESGAILSLYIYGLLDCRQLRSLIF